MRPECPPPARLGNFALGIVACAVWIAFMMAVLG